MQMMEARQRSIPVKSYTAMMQDVDRAITDSQDDGFVKIYVKDGTDEIVGSTIVASRASEMINEMSVIMSSGIGMRQLAAILHSYPSLSDAIRRNPFGSCSFCQEPAGRVAVRIIRIAVTFFVECNAALGLRTIACGCVDPHLLPAFGSAIRTPNR